MAGTINERSANGNRIRLYGRWHNSIVPNAQIASLPIDIPTRSSPSPTSTLVDKNGDGEKDGQVKPYPMSVPMTLQQVHAMLYMPSLTDPVEPRFQGCESFDFSIPPQLSGVPVPEVDLNINGESVPTASVDHSYQVDPIEFDDVNLTQFELELPLSCRFD